MRRWPLAASFFVLESRLANPIMPLRILRIQTLSRSSVIRGMLATGMFTTFFLGALYLEGVHGFTPVQTGLAFLPMAVTMGILSAGVTARLVTRFGDKRVLIPGMVSGTLGLLLLTTLGPDTSYAAVMLPAFVLIGAGAGTAFAPLLSIAMADVPVADAGLGSGIVNVSMQMASALGLAVLSAIATGRTHALEAAGHPTDVALTDGYRLAFLVSAILVGAGTVVAAVALDGRRPGRAARPRRSTSPKRSCRRRRSPSRTDRVPASGTAGPGPSDRTVGSVEPDDLAVLVDVDVEGRRVGAEAGHGAHVAADGVREAGAGRQPDLADGQPPSGRGALQRRVRRDREVGLGDAHRQPAEAVGLELVEPLGRGRLVVDAVGAVHPGGDGLDLLPQRRLRRVEEREGGPGSSAASATARARSVAPAPPSAKWVVTAQRTPSDVGDLEDGVVLARMVVGEGVDGHHRCDPVEPDVLDLLDQVGPAGTDLVGVLGEQVPGAAACPPRSGGRPSGPSGPAPWSPPRRRRAPVPTPGT